LPSHAHCPVIGVCLPLPVLRRLLGKALGNAPQASDYECHVAAVNESSRRMPIAENLQRELDRRYAQDVRRFNQAKNSEALAQMWTAALDSGVVAGALWASLTHPRCDDALRERICHDIHMFQHQAGACNRADLQQLERLQEEKAQLADELAAVRDRHAQALAQRDSQIESLNSELTRNRALLQAHDATLADLRQQLAQRGQGNGEQPGPANQVRRREGMQQRMHTLERERSYWRQRAGQAEGQVTDLQIALKQVRMNAASAERGAEAACPKAELGAMTKLRDKAILCVGGRPASVPAYRQLIECTGGRFLHHDGGEENTVTQLEASLAAADLVICQTGCVSHSAYWRVKDYCKRSGKRCVFVDKPSSSSLARCLREL